MAPPFPSCSNYYFRFVSIIYTQFLIFPCMRRHMLFVFLCLTYFTEHNDLLCPGVSSMCCTRSYIVPHITFSSLTHFWVNFYKVSFKGLFQTSTCWHPIFPVLYPEETVASQGGAISSTVKDKLHICIDLFLVFPFCPIGICVYWITLKYVFTADIVMLSLCYFSRLLWPFRVFFCPHVDFFFF